MEAWMEAHEDELGPIDIVVIAYPADAPMTGDAVPMLVDLVDRGIIRVLDVLFVRQNEDGTVSGFEASDMDGDSLGDFKVFEGASSGLLGEDDVATAACWWPISELGSRSSPMRSTPPTRCPDRKDLSCQDCFAGWPAPPLLP